MNVRCEESTKEIRVAQRQEASFRAQYVYYDLINWLLFIDKLISFPAFAGKSLSESSVYRAAFESLSESSIASFGTAELVRK